MSNGNLLCYKIFTSDSLIYVPCIDMKTHTQIHTSESRIKQMNNSKIFNNILVCYWQELHALKLCHRHKSISQSDTHNNCFCSLSFFRFLSDLFLWHYFSVSLYFTDWIFFCLHLASVAPYKCYTLKCPCYTQSPQRK